MNTTPNTLRDNAFHAGAALLHLAHERGKARGEWRSTAGNELCFSYRRVLDTHRPRRDTYDALELPKRNIPELICAIHCDLSEAFKGCRVHSMDDELPHRPTLESKLAKAVVRIFDIAGGMQLDLPGAIADQIKESPIEASFRREIRAIYSRAELDAEFKRLRNETNDA